MSKRIFLSVLLLLPLIIVTNCSAESALFARSAGLNDIQKLLPNKRSNKLVHPKTLFHTYVPGIGRVRIKLNQEKSNDVVGTFTKADNQVVEDNASIKLMRGTARMRSKEVKIAGSVFYTKGVPHLYVSFVAVNPRSGKSQLNKIKIPLFSSRKKARLYRVKRMRKHGHDDDHVVASYTSAYPALRSLNKSQQTAESGTFKAVDLNIDADQDWFTIFGTASNSVLTSYLNEAEVIYENDLGLTFNVVRQNVYESTSFGTNNALDRLCNYQYFVTGASVLEPEIPCNITAPAGPQSFFGNSDSYHLFTGEDLQGGTIGIAFLGAVCASASNAIGVTQLTSDALTPITFAHELGHKLSAIHDNSSGWNGFKNASCPATSTPQIMGAVVGATPPDTFSDCSKSLIEEFVGLFGSCLAESAGGGGGSGGEDPGGGSGSDPGEPAEALSLSTSLKRSGNITSTISFPIENLASYTGCTLRLQYEKKKNKVDSSSIFFDYPVTSQEIILTGKYKKNVKENSSGNKPKVFQKAKIICGTNIVAESSIKKIKPGKVKSKKEVGVKKWMKKAGKVLS